jgi:hypothetical protein
VGNQRRVTFWFGRDSDVRYLAEPPEVGDFVSHGNELWLVSKVEEDALGTSVSCEQTRETRAPRREGFRVSRDG